MKTQRYLKSLLIDCFVVLAFAIFGFPAFAQMPTPAPAIWTANAGDWSDRANWNPDVPDCFNDVYINNGGKAEIHTYLDFEDLAHSVTLGRFAGDSGHLAIDGTYSGRLNVCNEGDVYIGNEGNGTVTIDHEGIITSGNVFIAASRRSNGSVTVTGVNSIWSICNGCPGGPEGTVLPQLNIGMNSSGENGGTALLSVSDYGLVVVYNFSSEHPAVLVGPSGTLTGNGIVEMRGGSSSVMEIRGTIAPTGRTLTIGGDLTFNGTSAMQCNVTQQDNATSPQVSVLGQVSLDGRLSVTMTGDFSSAPTRYTLLSASSRDPNHPFFFSVSIKYPTAGGWTPHITYDGGYVYLDRVYDLNP